MTSHVCYVLANFPMVLLWVLLLPMCLDTQLLYISIRLHGGATKPVCKARLREKVTSLNLQQLCITGASMLGASTPTAGSTNQPRPTTEKSVRTPQSAPTNTSGKRITDIALHASFIDRLPCALKLLAFPQSAEDDTTAGIIPVDGAPQHRLLLAKQLPDVILIIGVPFEFKTGEHFWGAAHDPAHRQKQ